MSEINNKISIIMPCYNCKVTVEEAMKSIYEQNFSFPYEIIMVDDGSTDGTRDLIIDLSKKYPNVVCFFHEKNKGGGAARNTGIKKSSGDLIFCLDSDNVLYKNSLNKMAKYLVDNKYDGVVFYERRFFRNTNKRKFLPHINKILNRSIIIEDLFNGSDILLDNFLFTRKAFDLTGGYPENHGFDTQCFEMRFLAKGFSAKVCPETIFYHRQSAGNRSYFERVYEKGELSRNYYLIFEDIMYLFSLEVRKQIMNYQIFYDNAIKSSEIDDVFCLAIYYFKQSEYLKSIDCYKQLIVSGVSTQLLYFNILRNYLALSGKYDENMIEDEVSILARSFVPHTQNTIFLNGIWKRLIHRIKRHLFKI